MITFVKKSIENCKNFIENNDPLFMAFLIPLCLFATYIVYYVIINIFYIPNNPSTAYAVFLTPRYYGGMNDIPSKIFSNWWGLIILLPVLFVFIRFSYWLGMVKNISFKKYMLYIYFGALFMELMFLFLNANGLTHIILQAKSINNGLWAATHALQNQYLNGMTFINKLKYIYQVWDANHAPLDMPGNSHPAGDILIAFGILKTATALARVVGLTNIDAVAAFWTVIVTSLNTLLIPVIMMLAKEIYSENIGKITGVMMLTIPSVCMHFCAMIDVLDSLLLGVGLLFLVYSIKVLSAKPLEEADNKLFYYGLIVGVAFTLAAQFTFGQAFPIAASVVAFLIVCKKADKKKIAFFMMVLIIPAIIWFLFEHFISAGRYNYIVRSLWVTSIVKNSLEARTYPLSQIANFIIMFVIGGVLVLPTILNVVASIFKQLFYRENTTENNVDMSRRFVTIAVFIMFCMLASQKTVRLEVERTWHWFFVPIWALMGIYFEKMSLTVKKIFNFRKESNVKWFGDLGIIWIQLIITVVLAITIIDYY